MGFFNRRNGQSTRSVKYVGSPDMNSIAAPGCVSPGNTPPPSDEQAVHEQYRPRHEAAIQHYRKTGDGSRMWDVKSAEVEAIREVRSRRARRRR
ncbi:hypothetical protein [Streptomyces sp. NPDC001054]